MTDPGTAPGDTTACVGPNHHADAPPQTMRILPVERAVEWIRAWAELDWPITWETAYATRDKLGWIPAPDDGRFFTTELSTNGQEDGNITRLDGQCSGVSIPLCSRNLQAKPNTPWTTSLWQAYDAVADALTSLYGPGKQTGNRTNVLQTDWMLSNQVTVTLVASDKSMSVMLDSPEVTEIGQWELYYIEKYGDNYVDDESDTIANNDYITPVEVAVRWIRTWAELDWPITWETAYATRDKLGWPSAPSRLFTKGPAPVGQDEEPVSCFRTRCTGVSVALASTIPPDQESLEWISKVWAMYDRYARSLTYVYGAGSETGRRSDVLRTDWHLPNRATISPIGSAVGVDARLYAPDSAEPGDFDSVHPKLDGRDPVCPETRPAGPERTRRTAAQRTPNQQAQRSSTHRYAPARSIPIRASLCKLFASRRVLPVERAMAWILTWAELDWPITWETARAACDSLGWIPDRKDARRFRTYLSPGREYDGRILDLDGEPIGASIPLTRRNPRGDEDPRRASRQQQAYNGYVDAFHRSFGVAWTGDSNGSQRGYTWALPDHVTVSLLGSVWGVDAIVGSPAYQDLLEQERQRLSDRIDAAAQYWNNRT